MSVKVMVSASPHVNSYGTGKGVYFLSTMGVVSINKCNKEYAVKDGGLIQHFKNGELSYQAGVMILRTNAGNYSWRVRK